MSSKLVRNYEHTDEVVEIMITEIEDDIEDLDDETSEQQEDLTAQYVREELREAKRKADAIIAKANLEAKKIIDDANAIAQALQKKQLEEAQVRIQELEDQALRDGYEQGFLRKSEEITETLQIIHREMKGSINYLKQQNAHFVKQYEEQLKFLALEIASKILHQRVEADPMVLHELVQETLTMTKKSKKVQIQLPENAKALMEALEEDFRNQIAYQGRVMNVETADLPAGAVLVETDMGLFDASIDTQLENLKKLFMEYE